jgi:uncharacterized membrane protein YwzB
MIMYLAAVAIAITIIALKNEDSAQLPLQCILLALIVGTPIVRLVLRYMLG